MTYKEGTYAEYVSAKEEWLAYVPQSLPLHEAGQVPLVALTCWQVCTPFVSRKLLCNPTTVKVPVACNNRDTACIFLFKV